ncbi:MAG TPA: thioredoxin fold domain-containing protein [Baekduia sp.]
MPRVSRSLVLMLVLAIPVAVAVGCGGSSGGDNAAAPAQPTPTAKAEDFPASAHRTLPDLIQNLPSGPQLAPSVSVLDKGTNRFGFALFDTAGKQLSGAGVALYLGSTDGSMARGPYLARSESLKVSPQFESKQTATDPNAARGVYVADLPFKKNGKYAVLAIAKLDGRLVATSPIGVQVGGKKVVPPGVGDKAPMIHTLTPTDVAGDLAKIDTRVPPAPSLLKDDFADVVGKKPVVLTFATPQLCQSRVCGPVVDVVDEVQAKVGDKVSFIHQEVYQDNDINKGLRQQLQTYRLQTEPWTFVIDKNGVISTRFEGAFSAGELERAVAKVDGSGGAGA